MATKSTKTTRAAKSTKATKATKTTRTTRATKSQPEVAIRPSKPVFRMGTWIAVLLFAVVIGAAVYLNRQAEATAEVETTPEATEEFLFAQDVPVTSIEVKPAEGETVRIERNEENAWALTLPTEAEADQGLAEAAASQVTALRIITDIDGSKDPIIFGFDAPDYVITVGFEDSSTSTLEVGDITPSGNGYYVRQDDNKFYVVALNGISSLINLATTPPYLNTPTPVPTSTSTPLPTETPVPTATP